MFNFNVKVLSTIRVGRKYVNLVVAETCEAIYLSLKNIYLKSPKTPEQCKNISSKLEEL